MTGAGVILIFALSFAVFWRHLKQPVYEPLRSEGLLWKRTGYHLLQALLRDKVDPLKPVQMQLAIYGLALGTATIAAVAALIWSAVSL